MVLIGQLASGSQRSFVRVRWYAYALDRRLGDLAGDVVVRRVRLSPDPDGPGSSRRRRTAQVPPGAPPSEHGRKVRRFLRG